MSSSSSSAAAAAPHLLLGEDGRGYELARRLDACGAWRAWLGDAAYAVFAHALSSAATWESFLSPISSPSPSPSSRARLHLQLRARALLFDKASLSLFLPPASASSTSLANINPNYLQLHGDDVYFTLEDDREDDAHIQAQSRHRHEEWPETWYKQFADKHRIRHHRLLLGDKEIPRRTPDGMSIYLKLCNTHKRKRQAFNESQFIGTTDSTLESNSADEVFFPEIMFPSDCVPDTALPQVNRVDNQKVEIYGVLENLPPLMTRSPAMIERFGIIPEYQKMGRKYRGKYGSGEEGRSLSREQALQMTLKVVARFLATAGFEGGNEVSLEVLSEVFGRHISKLGRTLKLLSDGYKKQFTSIELLKMFLQAAGYSTFGVLAEFTKGSNQVFTHQMQQQNHPMQSQHQNPLLQVQQYANKQFQRPLPQMNMGQTLAFQQQHQLQPHQWEELRRRQLASPRGPVMLMDKGQQMLDVKIENMMDAPIDNSFSALKKHQLLRQQQQQLAMANHQAQSAQQFNQLPPVQLPQLQAQNPYSMRMTPVKVEAFHELMAGDSTSKHENEQNKLTPPPK
ncbi:uncharacterized protein LOC109713049 isoform X1 [Ananas comosus]|uniref:Uncharacterized protein LOC109713049 isoform X1 n=1 Tax=Ananas comosus TaxID=4615 RepID=A0A199VDL8_ANACO|nr:uncharacterized protein LOC109713049 isoform X1 [Ananas comosus]OAY75118.1 hypothetical protein ACMD2_08673 [Ananas comosus]